MNFTLSLLLSSASEVEWSGSLMIGWIVIAFALTVIEVFWLKGGLSSETLSPVPNVRDTMMPDNIEKKRLRKKMLDRWENEGGRIALES
jgi:hypothetical protein